jgi:small subunit ribosomal protein S24e
MEVKIASTKENPLLKRKEVYFSVEQDSMEKTPTRLEVKKALATKLNVSEAMVFVKKMQTMTGTHTTVGNATTYKTVEQAKFIEPEYIRKRNSPPEEPKEEENE